MSTVHTFLTGAIASQYLVASLFFVRYARKTADGFFLAFAVAFALLAAERVISFVLDVSSGGHPLVYLVRLCAFIVVIAAVLNKNRIASGSANEQ